MFSFVTDYYMTTHAQYYAAVQKDLGAALEGVRAITQHGEEIVLGLDNQTLCHIQVEDGSEPNKEKYKILRKRITGVAEEIYRLDSNDNFLFIHFRRPNTTSGLLLSISLANEYQSVAPATEHFTMDKKMPGSSFIITAEDTQLTLRMNRDGNWVVVKTFQCKEHIESVAMSEDRVFVLTNTKSEIFHINDPTTRQSLYNAPSPNKFGCSIGGKDWFGFFGINSVKFNDQMTALCSPYIFEESTPFAHILFDRESFCSLCEEKVHIYDFAKTKTQISLNIPQCANVCDGKVMVVANNRLFELVDVSESIRALREDHFEAALSRLCLRDLPTCCGLFELLWNDDIDFMTTGNYCDSRKKALNLLRSKPLTEIIPDLLDKFEGLRFIGNIPLSRIPNAKSVPLGDHEVELLEILKTVQFDDEDDLDRVDTAICQILCRHRIGELKEFLDQDNYVNYDSMQLYFKDFPHPLGQAIYLGSINSHAEAIELIEGLEDPGPVLIEKYIELLTEKVMDWEFVSEHLDWIFAKDPIGACNLLTDKNVDISRAKAFVSENYKGYYIRILLGSLSHPMTVDPERDVEELVPMIGDFLLTYKTDQTNLGFLKCIARGDGSIENIEKELCEMFIHIITTYPDKLNKTELMNLVNKINIKKLQVEAYRATGRVDEALETIWEKDNEGLEECIQFCKTSADPQLTFNNLFALMQKHLAKDVFIVKLKDIVRQNYLVIDVAGAFQFMEGAASIADVAPFVAEIYRMIVETKRDAQIQASINEAEKGKAEFTLAKKKMEFMQLTSDTKCSVCGKKITFQYVVMKPNGQVCHYGCLPH